MTPRAAPPRRHDRNLRLGAERHRHAAHPDWHCERVTSKLFAAPFVSHDAGVLAGAVVLRPSTAVDRLLPMQAEPSPIAERAIEQHDVLVRTLRDRRVAVTVLEPVLRTPAESLVGDLALVLAQGAVIARPSSVDRRPETAAIETVLAQLGIPILGRIAAPGLLDAGDAIVAGDTLYVGVPRAGAAQGLRTVELALDPGVLRLRNVLSFVAHDTAIVAPERVDTSALAGIRLIAVPLGEEYAAGVLALGGGRVIANLRYRESLARLRDAKIAVEAIDLWEFGKAGAGPFSLVLATKRG
jgi:dimethylargininase